MTSSASPSAASATLRELYRNHGRYVSQVSNVTEQNLADGFIVGADADTTLREAAQIERGQGLTR